MDHASDARTRSLSRQKGNRPPLKLKQSNGLGHCCVLMDVNYEGVNDATIEVTSSMKARTFKTLHIFMILKVLRILMIE